jgi:hypothetical protein
MSFQEVVEHILKMEEKIQLKVVLLLWLWWTERNGVREGELMRSVADLAYVVDAWKHRGVPGATQEASSRPNHLEETIEQTSTRVAENKF